jgi:aryl-alcohol dehydrogenase-like predicted oxidoreductase
MRTRSLGRSGIEVGEIGLGTWGLSGEGYGPIEASVARATVEAALEAGVTFIETAAAYGEGGALEGMLGEVARAHGRDKVFLCVRIGVDREAPGGPRKRFDYDAVMTQAQRTLKRLGVEQVDALVLHNPQIRTIKQGDAVAALKTLQHDGLVRLIGVSAGSQTIGRLALNAGIDLLELPYNMLHPKLLHSLAGEIATSGAGVIARSPLAYGVLAGSWGADRKFAEGDHRNDRWTTEDLARRVQQREATKGMVHGAIKSVRELALRYVLANGLVSVVVPGARTPEQARENAAAADELPYLPDEDLSNIGELLRNEGVEF